VSAEPTAAPRLRLERCTVLDPRARGRALGQAFQSEIDATAAAYARVFRLLAGLEAADVLRFGERVLAAAQRWRPALAEELAGVAEGCGHAPELVAALNGRTEAMALQECSVIGRVAGEDAPWLAQNWDWYDDATGRVVLWGAAVEGGERFLTMTEAGVLGKIGVSSRGVAVALSLLEHADDGRDVGVPVHLLLREVLGTCGSVDDVAALLADAPVSASSALTVVDAAGDGASFELSPAGVRRVEPHGAFVWHTNHFLDDELARGERNELLARSHGRLASLQAASPATPAEARTALGEHGCLPQPVCRHGDDPTTPGLPATATVASLLFEPAAARLAVTAGPPCRTAAVAYAV
jgi:isopenicillin-N N-acyltransferase-like protein